MGAENGHEGVVKMLLEREEVNANWADTERGRTPLGWAAGNGYEGVVKMLLEREEVNPDLADTEYGRTPLSWAAQNGNEGVVKILLEREDVNPDHVDTEYGRTPLSWAARQGYKRIVRTFLELEGINLDKAVTECGKTSPSSFAQQPEECLADDMQFKPLDPNTDMTDLNGQPRSPSPTSDGPEPVLDLKDSISMSLYNDPRSTEPSMLPIPSPLWPFKFLYQLRKSDTHPNNSRPLLPIAVNHYRVIGSCICLLALFVSRKKSHNRTSLRAVGDAFARKVLHFFVFLSLKVGLWNLRRKNLG